MASSTAHPQDQLLSDDTPVLDFTRLVSTTDAAALADLRRALTAWGFFQLVNHGVEASLMEKLRDLSRQFFALRMEEKEKYAQPANHFEGYSKAPAEENRSDDWNERMYILALPKSDHNLRYWPQYHQSFRDTLMEYADGVKKIEEQLLKAMARSISLPEDCFLKGYGNRPTMLARLGLYPPSAHPDQVLGIKPHTDGSGITFLLQDDDVEGLQVLKDGQWRSVPALPRAFLVNLGDQMEILSNGVFCSPMHRVLTNSEKPRMTLAMFCSPDVDHDVEPVEKLVSSTRPRLFKKVRNYGTTFFPSFQQGKRAIDALRI
ncbi:protein SRG1-like [Andrographis paniculata]|uniref:protein SRG1-like n=1 Tax=Andrographis paniculata TaxID=175694 RepID=UPI0021E6DB1E|nr:protein SRG1-like [Andrographis paniculata]